ncbi:MAG: spermidine/putrescine ABC transporter permease PotC [Sulfuricurvum sp.]|uniref:spermidine/putrescine ABC transporter permease PotC n=1 Tax=Sulfuricurvum sp. TaxID=2025608 RepID=UPI002634A6B6|nr:spermidine/putrescine ABC transporter permease PotC [Sulfuricurvum sp.]MDD2830225.1 spermidine/putrescine ABC transporter permease PotC [Sulfuricurvum sp.]MDD4950005.1 spermidine/putrescine ABC transporter permease PotC [Sulfuricurvum sp.]
MNFFKRLYIGFIFLFLYVPIFILILYSFNNSKYSLNWTGFTLKWYDKLFLNEELLDAAINSIMVATSSSLIATLLGTLGAIAFFRYTFFGKKFLNSIVFVLIISPEIVMGIALLLLFVLLNIELGFNSLLIAHISFSLPFVIVTVMSRLSGFDKNIIEAARDLGAHEFDIFRLIILPNIFPAVIAGFLLSFTLSLDDVIISFFVSGTDFEILPIKIFSMVRLGVSPEINALSAIMFGFTILIVALSQFLIREKTK